jgi:hypothetical protein
LQAPQSARSPPPLIPSERRAYFYGPSRSPGTLRNLDPGVSYGADWFDPRTGTWTPLDTDLRADNGQWKIPLRPDGDWILVVRKRDRTATKQMVVAPSDAYPRNSEATLIVSNSSELLLFYGAHVGSGDWDRAVIRAVRSADGGRTWSEPITQLEDPQRSLFQPSLTRLANGELGLTHTVLAHEQDAYKVFRRSADEGCTWSEPLKISDASHAYTTWPTTRTTSTNGAFGSRRWSNMNLASYG